MAWSCEGVHLSDYFLCLTSDMLQQRQLTERIVPNQRATSLKAQLLHGKFDFPRRSLWSKKKLLSKAATVLLFFFCILAHDAFRPIKPIIQKIHDCNDKCMNNHDSGKIMCVNMCQPHGIKFFCPGPSAHAVAPHQGFQQARAPSPWCFRPSTRKMNVFYCMSICIVWTAPKLTEGISNWLLLNLWDRVKSQLAKSQNIAAVSTVFLGTGPQFGKKIDFSCTDPKSVGIPDVATCNKRCCIGSRKPGPCLRSLR